MLWFFFRTKEPFNQLVAGSNPAGRTNLFNGLSGLLKANSRLGTDFGTNFSPFTFGTNLVNGSFWLFFGFIGNKN